MRSASGPPARAISSSTRPKPGLRRRLALDLELRERRRRERAPPAAAAVPFCTNGTPRRKSSTSAGGSARPGEPVPLLALVDALARAQLVHLRLGHQAGVVVLVALEGQAEALDGVGDEAHRLVGRRAREGFQDGLQVVAAEVGHQPRQLGVVVPAHDVERVGMDRRDPPRAAAARPRRPGTPAPSRAGWGSRRSTACRRCAAGLGEGRLQQLAVLDQHDLPAEVLEQRRPSS